MNAVVQQLDELDIARAIRDGEMSSPKLYHNVLIIALRISGTGLAYRSGDDEYTFRDPSNYLTAEFLERCQGLPVILDHPEGNVLDSEEFRDRIIGMIMLPYIKGEEVWGIAKIYDQAAAEMLVTRKLSTSPSVVLSGAGDSKQKLSSGKALLIEGRPVLLDHLAICALGTWDRGGPAQGVESIHAGRQELTMAAQIAALARRIPAQMDDPATMEIVARDAARYSAVAQAFGDSGPTPYLLAGETLLNFKARLASKFKHLDPVYKESNLYSIGDSAVLDLVTRSIYDSAEKEMKKPTGRLRSVTTREPGGHTFTRWYGDPANTWGIFMGGSLRFGKIVRPSGPK